MPTPELSMIAQGELPSGHRWTITAGGSPEDFSTMLETVHPDGHQDSGGMGGPLLYPDSALNTYIGADSRGLRRVLIRARPRVAKVRLTLGTGEAIDLAPIPVPGVDVVVFARLLPRASEVVSVDAFTMGGRAIR